MTEPAALFTALARTAQAMTGGPVIPRSGGIVIDDTAPATDKVFSSQKTLDEILKATGAVLPVPTAAGHLLALQQDQGGTLDPFWRPDRLPGLRLLRSYAITSSGQWVPDADGLFFDLKAVGGGAGGGGGASGDNTAVRTGGGGGASGCVTRLRVSRHLLASSCSVFIGAGGLGGLGVTALPAEAVRTGGSGSPGGDTYVLLGLGLTMRAPGGSAGQGGNPFGATGGAARNVGNAAQNQNAGGGSSPSNGTAGASGGIGADAPGGAGAGGGLNTAGTPQNGGHGMRANEGQYGAIFGGPGVEIGGTGGLPNNVHGADGATPYPGALGTAGGGGASNNAGPAGNGGHGNGAGAAGGGGGASRNGFKSGDGGNGFRGEFIVEVWGYAPLDGTVPVAALERLLIDTPRWQIVERATGRKMSVIHWDGESDLGEWYSTDPDAIAPYLVEPDDGTPIQAEPEPTPQQKMAAFLAANPDVLAAMSAT